MKTDTSHMRQAFLKPVSFSVRVAPEGFLLGGRPPPLEELQGRVTKVTLTRKLFRERALRCYSPQGIEARDGTRCQECLHPECRPRLRVHLRSPAFLYLLDLSGCSAENLFRLEDEAAERGVKLVDWILRLTVRNRGHWGEVQLERLSSLGGGAA